MLCIVVYIGMGTKTFELSYCAVHLLLCKSDKTVNSTGSATACVSTAFSQLPPLQPTLLLTWKEKSHSNMPTSFMPAPTYYLYLHVNMFCQPCY